MSKITSTLDLARPSSFKDIVVRAIKTATATFIGTLPLNSLYELDLSTLKVVAISAASAGGTVLINAILTWTQTPE